jgi:hypothetical protein
MWRRLWKGDVAFCPSAVSDQVSASTARGLFAYAHGAPLACSLAHKCGDLARQLYDRIGVQTSFLSEGRYHA